MHSRISTDLETSFLGLAADLALVFHFLWILFLIFGIIFAIRRSRIAWIHLGGLLFSLVINLFGWYCPLTHIENRLRLAAGAQVCDGSFIHRYLSPLVYPNLTETLIRGGEILFVLLNLGVYGFVALKYLLQSRPVEDQGSDNGRKG